MTAFREGELQGCAPEMLSHLCLTRGSEETPPPDGLTLHDLLQLHLQGLDGPRWVVTGPALYPVDGQPALRHGGHVVILQEDDAVGVFDHGAVATGGGRQKANVMRLIVRLSELA